MVLVLTSFPFSRKEPNVHGPLCHKLINWYTDYELWEKLVETTKKVLFVLFCLEISPLPVFFTRPLVSKHLLKCNFLPIGIGVCLSHWFVSTSL